MASKFKPFVSEIINAQKSDGKSAMAICREIAKREKLNFDSLYRYIKEKKLTKLRNTFSGDLEDNNFMPTNNWSHGWLKSENSSIFIKNPNAGDNISYEQVRDEVIADMKKHAPNYKKFSRPKTHKEGHALIIDIADLHIGKLSVKEETNDEYSIHIAITRAIEGVAGLLEKARGFYVNKIYFVIGNDVLHIDKTNRTTTAGTPQDTHGMWHQAFTSARKLYVTIIEQLLQVADVHVVHCPSNHDFMSGFMLADSVYSWFHNCNQVTFDVSNCHRKYVKYGNSLIGVSHGDGAKMPDYPLLMANEAPQLWAETKYRYVYLHHIHHKDIRIFQKAKDYQGATVEYLRSPSATDAWHHRNGYAGNTKAIEAFIHSEKFGQVAKLCHNF